ncbi:MAG: hypothetical protein A2Z18_07780 [Armatimonadetes bacterium RBG_16_58_9]|nr:MAG: hypothetical protein A2Z18_07780 [Armatimonadetes bacterium RBG_16_58_9]
MELPKTDIGGLEIARVVCGSNPFVGSSHSTEARARWLRRYFTHERIVEVLLKCVELGVNSLVCSPREDMHKALETTRKQSGKEMHWICTPQDEQGDIRDDIKWCADHGVRICMPHSIYTDSRLNVKENRIDGIEPVLESIRNHGMIPGLSTHRPEVLMVSQSAGYDVETCLLPFNVIGFLCAVEIEWTARVIRDYKKPVICIKPFAAGRITPAPALEFVFKNSKPIDLVCAGFLSPEEVEEDLEMTVDILSGRQTNVQLNVTGSKKALLGHLSKEEALS